MIDLTGQVKSISFKDSALGAGSVTILKADNEFKGVVTITHINPAGAWVVMGPTYSGALTDNMSLYRLVVEDKQGTQYTLANKYWNSAIQQDLIDTGKEVSFEKKPYPFYEGAYMCSCFICESHFQAAKKQALCTDCCETHTEAYLINHVSRRKERAKAITFTRAREMAFKAFQIARHNPSIDFDDWFKSTY